MKTINISSIWANADWLRQFPKGVPEWDGWRFSFNDDENHYDYLVVLDDLHAPIMPKCPLENILHIATEPFQHYQENFLAQFARILILTSRKTNHPSAIPHQAGFFWFLGLSVERENKLSTSMSFEREANSIYERLGGHELSERMNFEEMEALFDHPKSKLISVISSDLTITSPHRARLKFANRLKAHYGDKLDFYGRGIVPMDDKIESLKDYRFQIVLENAVRNNFFSEKLTDCILAGTYPIYHGCPNINDFFPENSYVAININRFDEAVAIIDNAIAQEYDQKYRAELRKAQQLALYEHNIYPMLIKLIGKIEAGEYGKAHSPTFFDKHMFPFRADKFHVLFPYQYRYGG